VGTNTSRKKQNGGRTMRRLFYQTKLYDYTSRTEAERHIKEMEAKGWHAKRQNDGGFVFMNNQDEFAYSVEFFKEI
jgi:hypothetical protein